MYLFSGVNDVCVCAFGARLGASVCVCFRSDSLGQCVCLHIVSSVEVNEVFLRQDVADKKENPT